MMHSFCTCAAVRKEDHPNRFPEVVAIIALDAQLSLVARMLELVRTRAGDDRPIVSLRDACITAIASLRNVLDTYRTSLRCLTEKEDEDRDDSIPY